MSRRVESGDDNGTRERGSTFPIQVPPSFAFLRTVYSHGWFDLAPFEWDLDRRALHRVVLAPGGRPRAISISEGKGSSLEIALHGGGAAGPRVRDDVARQVRHMFRLDEPFGDFHVVCRSMEGYAWVADAKAGPLLRAPDVFEDLVKMICTTNCTWALTRVMTSALVREMGEPVSGDSGRRSFPTAEAMASRPERFFVSKIKAGYRAAYLRELAKRVASGALSPSTWLNPSMPLEEIRKEIASVKGAGRYVADNVLKLVGRYDGLGIDSWCRRKFSETRRGGRPVTDKVIEKFYAPFGAWKGLALWCDLTRDWFDGDLPDALRLQTGKF
ncbi:MAG TPA: Fe-S cluster assembly protein HesB [Verrucomicrobiae bacterium]|nr:Fe-S cluster assembly protein HesB [Verrucomicrobiae bacterium]